MRASSQGPVVVASDHGGYRLKEAIKRWLTANTVQVLDVGTDSEQSCDYPVFARRAAQAVADGRAWRGVVVDGAGIGSAMVCNKVPGVRAGMAFSEATARNAAEHNGAQVLTLGSGYLDEDAAIRIVRVFLETDCTVDRHLRRVSMIEGPHGAAGDLRGSRAAGTVGAMNPGDHETLVQAIIKVLAGNPALMAGFSPAGAPAMQCTTCNPCNGHCAAKGPAAVRTLIGGKISDARISGSLGIALPPRDLAGIIDHTLLKPSATYDDIDRLCDEAARCGFMSVCVNPLYVRRCADRLRGQSPLVCTVIGFPLGATPKENKALEARRAIRDGAKEIDMVISVGALRSGDHRHVYDDIRVVSEVARDGGAILKVIIETALLTDEEKIAACVLAKRARAHFVKTSTGFAKGGATVADVALMAEAVEYKLEVKASGGIRDAADAQKMVAAGATRIGASVGLKISGCDSTASSSDAY